MSRGVHSRAENSISIPRIGDPASASPDERDEHLMLLEAARHELEVEWTETLAAADEAGDHDLFGYPSTVAYLKHRLDMAGGRANRYVKNARAAARFEATFSAWKHRQVSSDEAELLFDTSRQVPDEFPTAEHDLLELVGDSYDETRKLLDYWLTDVNDQELDLEAQLARRRLDVGKRRNGMVAGRFELAELAGEAFLAAIDALMPPPAAGDERTAPQRRADALEDLSRSILDGGQAPIFGGEKPHMLVHVGLGDLLGYATGLRETADGWVLDPETIRQMACDCSVTRVVFGGPSEVLDVGRKTRVVPAAMRRAVIARDRTCIAPGCSRSARWCDIHHIIHWDDGGETEISNLCLLCRYHHTLVHLDRLDLTEVLRTAEPVAVGAVRGT